MLLKVWYMLVLLFRTVPFHKEDLSSSGNLSLFKIQLVLKAGKNYNTMEHVLEVIDSVITLSAVFV